MMPELGGIPRRARPGRPWPLATFAAAAGAVLAALIATAGEPTPAPPAPAAEGGTTRLATFAGGCFWCMETPFEELDGVSAVISGYTGGRKPSPTYEEVSAGGTAHAEAVEVVYDPSKISYEKLLEIFWRNVDPLQANGQFCDHGTQYRSAIFYRDEEQRKAAEESKHKLEEQPRFKGKIVTQIVPTSTFYPAEEYHQDFYKKNPVRYHMYRTGCGRDARLKEIWGKPLAGGHK
jgi:peptide-methionine (S)-S-oxide reductase